MEHWYPLLVLAIGVATVLTLIIRVRANAFLALITAAMVVSLLSPGAPSAKISRVATAFGSAAGSIGVVIALAAIIGKCMLDSGAADRIVRAFTQALGERRAPLALMGSGYVLAIPVFFDTVFYLLVPLARSLYKKTGKDYLKYLLTICVGGALTHTLVPPTPGPLLMAAQLQVDLGVMMLVGAAIALPSAFLGLALCGLFDSWLKVPFRQLGQQPELEPIPDEKLPGLFWSIMPVILPVLMISANTILTTLADAQHVARLQPDDVDWAQLPALVSDSQAPVGQRTSRGQVVARIAELLAPDTAATAQVSSIVATGGKPSTEASAALVTALNERILANRQFYDEASFLGVPLSGTIKSLMAQNRLRMKQADVERMNRLLLESALGDTIRPHQWQTSLRTASDYGDLLGNANLALLLSGVIAMVVLFFQRGLTLQELGVSTETALMSGGVIILITSAGGAFGAMLSEAQVGVAIESQFQSFQTQSAGGLVLVLGFAVAVVLKIAQGSSTVAMITGSSMLAGIADPATLGFHPVYLATAIGSGSLVGSWMNDSGFWIFAKMGGLTEEEALKSWTPLLSIVGIFSFLLTLLMARVLPLT